MISKLIISKITEIAEKEKAIVIASLDETALYKYQKKINKTAK